FEYARTGNPTRKPLEANLAAIEAGTFGRAFSSGMAATDCLLRSVLRPGDHLVIPNDAYGGTFRLIDKVFTQWGIEYTPAPISDVDAVREAMRPTTKLVWVETPTNPLLNIGDIAALADVAHTGGAKIVVDNTFASPYLQQPLTLGADVALHSTTKYLGGHSDVVGGALVTNDEELDAKFAFLQNGAGAVPGPFDAYLTMRGIKTLALRMERHSDNAEKIVELLDGHPAVTRVIYPGHESHPDHAVASKQMRRFGGMISLRLAGGKQAALDFCARTEIFTLAESLGGVESLIEHPGAMTHASTAGSLLEVPDDLVRLSVGIEDAADLLADVEQALTA
ncbi:MAG: cystathionine gamma-synthase, partial [Acidobacteria bacterium]